MITPIQKKPNLVSVTSINADGSHFVLHPADVSGKFTSARRLFGYLLICVYVLLPWIPINGAPALFFDVENRRFHVMGITLVTQDLWVMFFGITGLGFSLFFLTSLLGRVWCGWACPYTVFLEHVFRRIERFIDGDSVKRKALQNAPWDRQKLIRAIIKQSFYIIAVGIIAHVFMSYFVSLPRLYQYVKEGPMMHATVFTFVFVLTGILWFCFSMFREQFCILMCPYGRLQSALSDDDTMIIGYDQKRGEPRGAAGKVTGDCIDCKRCINVCPTGIDIRNGLQLECIGCAACVDACDAIMDKVGRPRGLVRYDSLNGLEGKIRRIMRPRVKVYLALASLGIAVMTFIAWRMAKPYYAEFTRISGPAFYVDAKTVRNMFSYRVMNKRNQEASFRVELIDAPAGYILSGGDGEFKISAQNEVKRTAVIAVPHDAYSGTVKLKYRITGQPGDVTLEGEFSFMGPHPQAFQSHSTTEK